MKKGTKNKTKKPGRENAQQRRKRIIVSVVAVFLAFLMIAGILPMFAMCFTGCSPADNGQTATEKPEPAENGADVTEAPDFQRDAEYIVRVIFYQEASSENTYSVTLRTDKFLSSDRYIMAGSGNPERMDEDMVLESEPAPTWVIDPTVDKIKNSIAALEESGIEPGAPGDIVLENYEWGVAVMFSGTTLYYRYGEYGGNEDIEYIVSRMYEMNYFKNIIK